MSASALLEFLLQTSLGNRVEARIFREGDELHVPHLVDVEIVQALRRLVAIQAPIVTCDGPLAKASGHRARIELIA